VESPSRGVGDHPLILVADDDPAVRALFGQALARHGLKVVLAANGREAIQQLTRHEIDVALLDVSMPVLDGLQALREIRADLRHRTLPIILVTGSVSESARIRGLEDGADDYVTKPVNLNELTARVRAHLRGRSAWRRELERGREDRRRLAAALDALPRNEPLVVLAARVAREIGPILGVDGVAILHFGSGAVRTIASTGDMAGPFPVGKPLARERGREIAGRAVSGPWFQNAAARPDPTVDPLDVAYVPFRLGMSPQPLGCLAFGVRSRQAGVPLSHRLPDLVDATDFVVTVLRPAVEQAETTGAATTRLQGVIARHEFDIHLQPIARLDTGEQIAVEALTRFRDGIRPDLQFAEAASLGLGPALQRATLVSALRAAASMPPTVALSVNLSADVLLLEPAIPELLADARRQVIVEITEHERIDDYQAVRAALGRLGPHVKLAIDDAGSGYASLRHILALEPAYVKLDIEWVRNIDRDPVRRALVSGLTYFASETGCELIAEGIETQEELAALRDLGVGLGQGYLLGRPKLPM
jgi:EAL domain-containing protein (putative c-di-GMP-specific phosphodiesterase class I)/DNA-binding NarL/FixJ family response regulator